MPKNSSDLHAVARLTSALYSPRFVDAHALYWSPDDLRFAAASLAGERSWEVEVEDGSRLVGIFEGHPVVLTSRLDPPFALALVFLDPASGREVRRVAAPEDTAEAAHCDGVFAFLAASKRLGPANRLVLADATTGERRTLVEGGLASGLAAFAGGFLFTLDDVVRAYDPKGRLMWATDSVVTASGSVVLATALGGELARLRPEDGAPVWSFAFPGAQAQSLVQVHAGADAVAVLEPRLGELALLDLATGALRWRTKRVAATTHTPPLVTRDAVVALSARKAGGGWQALAAFSRTDGSLRGELANRHGFDLSGGLVAGEVCVLGQEGGETLHIVRVPQIGGETSSREEATSPRDSSVKRAAVKQRGTPAPAGNGAAAKKTAAKKTLASSVPEKTAAAIKTASNGTAAKKRAAEKRPVTGAAAKKTAAEKRPATGAAAKKTAAEKRPATGAAAKKTAAEKRPATGAAAKKTAAEKRPATSAAAKKTAAKKRPATKSAGKGSATRKRAS
ncbi:outer membrane protein assembly factor BamB family protein [Nannocystis punicea]|uniref:PQQ-binding-like beta-propeller repeat protein n=1 Tax=Nannocystis punicea TaxID=2995304 RepID=A0ABY7H7E6_9BACT|nr:PQQ-binding-like beta-propeller repeat protein [Nannocystis poenicansa]WAS94997.1 PQQ-binding-like beta-propeller repeat protein [Nannocystis poenicansa]